MERSKKYEELRKCNDTKGVLIQMKTVIPQRRILFVYLMV